MGQYIVQNTRSSSVVDSNCPATTVCCAIAHDKVEFNQRFGFSGDVDWSSITTCQISDNPVSPDDRYSRVFDVDHSGMSVLSSVVLNEDILFDQGRDGMRVRHGSVAEAVRIEDIFSVSIVGKENIGTHIHRFDWQVRRIKKQSH